MLFFLNFLNHLDSFGRCHKWELFWDFVYIVYHLASSKQFQRSSTASSVVQETTIMTATVSSAVAVPLFQNWKVFSIFKRWGRNPIASVPYNSFRRQQTLLRDVTHIVGFDPSADVTNCIIQFLLIASEFLHENLKVFIGLVDFFIWWDVQCADFYHKNHTAALFPSQCHDFLNAVFNVTFVEIIRWERFPLTSKFAVLDVVCINQGVANLYHHSQEESRNVQGGRRVWVYRSRFTVPCPKDKHGDVNLTVQIRMALNIL